MITASKGEPVDIPCIGVIFHGIVKSANKHFALVIFGDGSEGNVELYRLVKHVPKSI